MKNVFRIFRLILFMATTIVISGYIKSPNPHDVGLQHTHIIHQIQNRMLHTPPQNYVEYLHAISIEMRTHLCQKDDPVCNSRVVQNTIQIQPGPKNGHKDGLEYVKSILDDSDPELLTYIERLFSSLKLANPNMERTSQLIALMNKDFEDLASSEKISNEQNRQIGMVAYSVGMETTKQWIDVLKVETNPYHLLLSRIASSENDPHRKLQADDVVNEEGLANLDFTTPEMEEAFLHTLEADIIGATEGVISAFFDTDAENLSMVTKAVEIATISSTKAVVNTVIVDALLGGQAFDPCEFPDSFWCEGTSTFGITDINGITQGITGMIDNADPCAVPNNPFCPETGDETESNNGGNNGGFNIPLNPCSIPNNPLCADNINGPNQNSPDDPNGSENSNPTLPGLGLGSLGGLGDSLGNIGNSPIIDVVNTIQGTMEANNQVVESSFEEEDIKEVEQDDNIEDAESSELENIDVVQPSEKDDYFQEDDDCLFPGTPLCSGGVNAIPPIALPPAGTSSSITSTFGCLLVGCPPTTRKNPGTDESENSP